MPRNYQKYRSATSYEGQVEDAAAKAHALARKLPTSRPPRASVASPDGQAGAAAPQVMAPPGPRISCLVDRMAWMYPHVT